MFNCELGAKNCEIQKVSTIDSIVFRAYILILKTVIQLMLLQKLLYSVVDS